MIRKAVLTDASCIYALICDMEQTILNKCEFDKIFTEKISNADNYFLVYEDNKEILGVLHMRIEYQLHHCAKIAEVMELSVKEGFRSKGIGNELFISACKTAKELNCLKIEVCCNRLREKAHKFYEKQGMQKYHYKFTMDLWGNIFTENKLGL